ncbi:hypothetical protein [Microbacterium sp. NPDC087589]|uniref:hypothetical protein n=1 Tax=Microbacterium sp. NPDC087589 TaxID=3364191 RepID=UPI00381A834B
MIPLDFSSTVLTEIAPDGLVPVMVDMPTTFPLEGRSFRFEPWKVTDGQVYVIVRAADQQASLADSADAIETWVHRRWGADALIIEDWGRDDPRYRERTPDGGRERVDEMALKRRGLILTNLLRTDGGLA